MMQRSNRGGWPLQQRDRRRNDVYDEGQGVTSNMDRGIRIRRGPQLTIFIV
jgi:hypothetical protein